MNLKYDNFWIQRGAMGKTSGLLPMFYFLGGMNHYKVHSMVYFLQTCQNYAFTKLFLFTKFFHGLPISCRKKSEVFSVVPQDPPDQAPSTLFTSHRRHMEASGAGPPCPVSSPWTLCSQLSSGLTPSLHLGVCVNVCLQRSLSITAILVLFYFSLRHVSQSEKCYATLFLWFPPLEYKV